MGHTHFIKKCVHGYVVVQCRCEPKFTGGKPKKQEIVPCPPECRENKGEGVAR